MSFHPNFLADIAAKKNMTNRETEIFIEYFSRSQTRQKVIESLHISETLFATSLTGVYKKFDIAGYGPGKESALRDKLKNEEDKWEKMSGNSRSPDFPVLEETLPRLDDIRLFCFDKVRNQCSTVRLFNRKEVNISKLYVDVYLLSKSPKEVFVSKKKLLENFDLRGDRIGLGDRIERISGIDAANQHPNLLILGKPGAGKTTFLKRLAIGCVDRSFQPDLIPVFIELRKIKDNTWNLIDIIDKSIGLENWQHSQEYRNSLEEIKRKVREIEAKLRALEVNSKGIGRSKEYKTLKDNLNEFRNGRIFQQSQLDSLLRVVKEILGQGKLLILMDGLDEVPTVKLRNEVQEQFRDLSEEYPGNRFILTCRTQVIDRIPDRFDIVEVADFRDEQVIEFVDNWLSSSGMKLGDIDKKKSSLNNAFNDNPALKELSRTPVLLSLICMLLGDQGSIPSDVILLYRKGIRLLLQTWNETKGISDWEMGDEIYRRLSISEKEDLLIELAALKFENPRNFVVFDEEPLSSQISELLNLPDRNSGRKVLKAIESHHGLLIERADQLWSFSHLTFQEYFAIQWLTQLPPTAFTQKMSNQHWQKITKRLVLSKQYNKYLFRLFQKAVNESVKDDSNIQDFLKWIKYKAIAIQKETENRGYKLPAIRAFYFTLSIPVSDGIGYIIDRRLSSDVSTESRACLVLDKLLVEAVEIADGQDFSNVLAKVLSDISSYSQRLDGELAERIELLRLQLKYSSLSMLEDRKKWWKTEGVQWSEGLWQISRHYRNVGYRWEFSQEQLVVLKNYYKTNLFILHLASLEKSHREYQDELADNMMLPFEDVSSFYTL